MIEGVYIYRKGGEVIGSPLPAFDDLFLQIESDNLGAGLNFRVKLTNQNTNQYYNLKLYPKIGSTIVNRRYHNELHKKITYISSLIVFFCFQI